jgi:hypothetical protein
MKIENSALRTPSSALAGWLPDMDLNHDKQIQSLLCYRYTIGQTGAWQRLERLGQESSRWLRTGYPQPATERIRKWQIENCKSQIANR